MNQRISTPLAITIIVVLSLLLIGGIFGYWYFVSESEEEYKSPEMKKSREVSSEISETLDWKTYRNEEYGYKIKYPLDGTIKEVYSGMPEIPIEKTIDIRMKGIGIRINA